MLMHSLWGFVLHLDGNTATPFLRCISMSWVAIESCYGHRTRLCCVWTAISQRLIWVAIISLRGCNKLVLMHPLFRIVLYLVGNTATPFPRCTRHLRVAIESCYGHHIRVGCVWTAISQCLIWVANISLHCCNTRRAIASFLAVGDSPRGPLEKLGNPHLKPATKPKPNKPHLTMQGMAHAAKAPGAHQAAHSKTPSNRYRLARGYAPPSGGLRPDRGGAPPSSEVRLARGSAPPSNGVCLARGRPARVHLPPYMGI
jgi:hypothetical protein